MKIRNKHDQTGKMLKKPAMWLYCVILCVALLASLTLAWYVSTVEVSDNKILTSTFEMTAKIENGQSQVTLTAKEDGAQEATLTAGTYTVTLGCSDKTNGHGFCIVTINGQAAQSDVFGKCGVENCEKCDGRESQQFTVTVPAGETWQISLVPHWGTLTPGEGVAMITANASLDAAG